MGIISFMKSAGEKLLGIGQAHAEEVKADPAAANAKAGEAIKTYVNKMGLDAEGLNIQVDGSQGAVTVSGKAKDQATKEKIVLCCGNVDGVEKVNDQLEVTDPTAGSTYHIVASGESLSAIAKKVYGDANKYALIFEANKPMLSDPDKIYPGQNLRCPPVA